MIFDLSIQCDSINDLKENLRELMKGPFDSNCTGSLKNNKQFDYSFVDTDNIFHDDDVRVIKPLLIVRHK